MHEKILHEMRARVRLGRIAISVHALDEMRNDNLIPDDLSNCILTGRIIERQFDEAYADYKYVIEGESLDPSEFIHVAAKLGRRNTVVITTYRVW